MRIVRQDFSGGLIGEELRWRSDTEQYAKSLIQCSNMLPTPYGGIMRRPPLKSIGSFQAVTVGGIVYFPGDARSFPFVFSSAYRYIASFVTYSATGQTSFVRLVVKNHAGVQKASLDVDYTTAEILEIDFHQSNDKMWITHNNHPAAILLRVSDTEWTFTDADLKYGPFLDRNENRSLEVSVFGEAYDETKAYRSGEVVQIGSASPTSITAAAYIYWYKRGYDKFYLLSLTVGSGHGFVVGDQIYISDLESTDHSFIGTYDVVRITATTIEINTGRSYDGYTSGHSTQYRWLNDFALPTDFSSATVGVGSGVGFYIASHTAQIGNIIALGEEVGTGKLVIEVDNPWDITTSDDVALFGTDLHDGVHEVSSVTGTESPYLIITTTDFAGADAAVGATIEFPVNIGNDPSTPSDYWRQTFSNFSATVQSNIDLFVSGDVGRKIGMIGNWDALETGKFEFDGGSGQQSAWVPAFGIVSIETSGAWDGSLRMEYSIDDGQKWELVRAFAGLAGSANHTYTHIFSDSSALVRLVCDGWTTTGISGEELVYKLSVESSKEVSMDIVEYVDARTVRVLVEGVLKGGFSTYQFSMGAFGGDQGYPACCTVYENRLWLSGTIGEPFRHFASMVDKYDNFTLGSFADSALIFETRADASTRISWVEPKGDLFFGTDFGEYSAVNLDSTQVLSADNPPKIDRHTSEGSARIGALVVGAALAYVSADKRKLKLLAYDGIEQDGYRSYDLTYFNPDITAPGIVGICYQRTPWPVIWAWLADGTAASFTINRERNVLGWAKHSTEDGLIKSMCVLPDANGIDEVYCVCDRGDVVFEAVGDGTTDPDASGVYTYVDGLIVVGSGSTGDNVIWTEYDTVESKPRFSRLGESNPTEFIEWSDDGFKLYDQQFTGVEEVALVKKDSITGLGGATESWALSSDGLHVFFAVIISTEVCIQHYVLSTPYDFSTMADAGDTYQTGVTGKDNLSIDISPDGYKIIVAYQTSSGTAQKVSIHLFTLQVKFSLSSVVDEGSVLCGSIAEPFHDCCRWVDNGTKIWSGFQNGIQCFNSDQYGLPTSATEIWKVKDTDELFVVRGFAINSTGTEVLVFIKTSTLARYSMSTPYNFTTRTFIESKNVNDDAGTPIPHPDGTLLYFFEYNHDEIVTLSSEFQLDLTTESDGWVINNAYIISSSASWPPETGWSVVPTGTPPAPSHVYRLIGYNGDNSYALVQFEDDTFGFVDVSTGAVLFESDTHPGEFTAVDGAGSTGTLTTGDLDYHSEKLDYSETEYLDNLDGPSEVAIESICEPSPLTRGPTFLEGNMKFRSNKGFLYVVKSNGGEVSVDDGVSWETLDYSKLTADSDGLYTGMLEFNSNSGYVDYSTLQIRTTGTYPLIVSALGLEVDKHEKR